MGKTAKRIRDAEAAYVTFPGRFMSLFVSTLQTTFQMRPPTRNRGFGLHTQLKPHVEMRAIPGIRRTGTRRRGVPWLENPWKVVMQPATHPS